MLELHEEMKETDSKIEFMKGSGDVDSSTIPSLDLVGIDVAITIKDKVFDKDLENKSSTRYKTLQKKVKQEVRKKE